MARTFELYNGGDRAQNADSEMFPSAPFVATHQFKPATHQQPVTFITPRTLDFSGYDQALAAFLNKTPLIATDILGTEPVPQQSWLFGVFWKVAAPLAGVSFSIKYRVAGTTVLTTTSAATATSGYAATMAPIYIGSTNAEMVDVVLDAVPAGGVSGLVLEFAPYYAYFTASTPPPLLP